jgi:hypothetical protein
MTQACIDFARSEEQEESLPDVYVLECTYDVFDPAAYDRMTGGPLFQGKTVEGGSWKVSSNSIDYLMTYAEGLRMTWATDKHNSPDKPYAVGQWELRRNGLPLFLLGQTGTWAAVGEDYMDPWEEEATSDTQLMVIPDENTPPDMDEVHTATYDMSFLWPRAAEHLPDADTERDLGSVSRE